jgi:hypothetical protein
MHEPTGRDRVTTIDPRTLAPEELVPMLRAWADGAFAVEAAVELVIAHRTWLARSEFRARLVDAVQDGWGPAGTIVPMATIDWGHVPALLDDVPSSSSESAILMFASSLAGGHRGASVLAMTAGLDDSNAALVLEAMAHRFGWHERGRVRLVGGTFNHDLAPVKPLLGRAAPIPASVGSHE